MTIERKQKIKEIEQKLNEAERKIKNNIISSATVEDGYKTKRNKAIFVVVGTAVATFAAVIIGTWMLVSSKQVEVKETTRNLSDIPIYCGKEYLELKNALWYYSNNKVDYGKASFYEVDIANQDFISCCAEHKYTMSDEAVDYYLRKAFEETKEMLVRRFGSR